MKLDSLNELKDEELLAVIGRSQELLKQRDDERKAKALSEARTLLASVGLSLKDLGGKKVAKKDGWKPSQGRLYQHPDDPGKTWNGRGPHPGWVNDLIASGRHPKEAKSAA